MPPGATFDAATRTFTWQPSYDDAGSVTATFVADDGKGGSVSLPVNIAISDENRAPTFASHAEHEVREGEALTFVVAATDPDGGEAPVYRATQLPAEATFDAMTGTFTWQPAFTQAGAYESVFRAEDDQGAATDLTISITVLDANRASVLNEIPDQSVTACDVLTFVASASDLDDGDTLAFSCSDLPAGATFDASTATFTWQPLPSQAGTYPVTLVARDVGGAEGSLTHAITVEEAMPWDVSGDAVVDILDLVLVARAFGTSGDALAADVSADGRANIIDLVTVASYFGERRTSAAAAPRLLTPGDADMVERWLRDARRAHDGSQTFQRGIEALVRLRRAITPERTALLPNYPNPFNPETCIPFDLAEGSRVTVTISDAVGRTVRRLDLGYRQAGVYTTRGTAANWDGTSESGEPVASGVYFVEFRTDVSREVGRLIVLK